MPTAKKRAAPLEKRSFDDTFEIRESDTGAQGVFATVDIKIDMLINTESFVWMITDEPELDDSVQEKLPQAEQEHNEREHEKRQNASYEKQFTAVCNQFRSRRPSIPTAMRHLEPQRNAGESTGAWITRVLKINGWQYKRTADGALSTNASMLAMYKGSKFNHSCKPTLNARLILESRSAPVRRANTNATRGAKEFWVLSVADIKAGDEVTVTYLSPEQLRDDVETRRSYLKTMWGFDCLCVQCKDDLRALAETKVHTGVRSNFERLLVTNLKRAAEQTTAKSDARLQRQERIAQRHAKMTKLVDNVEEDTVEVD